MLCSFVSYTLNFFSVYSFVLWKDLKLFWDKEKDNHWKLTQMWADLKLCSHKQRQSNNNNKRQKRSCMSQVPFVGINSRHTRDIIVWEGWEVKINTRKCSDLTLKNSTSNLHTTSTRQKSQSSAFLRGKPMGREIYNGHLNWFLSCHKVVNYV